MDSMGLLEWEWIQGQRWIEWGWIKGMDSKGNNGKALGSSMAARRHHVIASGVVGRHSTHMG
jgi:hypothetical protein